MTTAAEPRLLTTADLLAMPDDGVERWLIRGQLREKPSEYPEVGMTVRNRHHSEVTMLIGHLLLSWVSTRPKPRGKVYGGEAGVRLLKTPESTVGVDVVYAPPDVVAVQSDRTTTLLDGVPTLVVEILSPNDTVDQIDEKVDDYLAAGVAAVWVVNVRRRTVNVLRPGHEPESFNSAQRLPELPEMPGFTPAVAELFE